MQRPIAVSWATPLNVLATCARAATPVALPATFAGLHACMADAGQYTIDVDGRLPARFEARAKAPAKRAAP
jgi:hypothetical protein